MNFMDLDFIFKIFLLQSKNIYTLKLIVGLNLLHLQRYICFQSFFSLPNKFVLFNNHNQPLKCVQQNSYLELCDQIPYVLLSDKEFIF